MPRHCHSSKIATKPRFDHTLSRRWAATPPMRWDNFPGGSTKAFRKCGIEIACDNDSPANPTSSAMEPHVLGNMLNNLHLPKVVPRVWQRGKNEKNN